MNTHWKRFPINHAIGRLSMGALFFLVLIYGEMASGQHALSQAQRKAQLVYQIALLVQWSPAAFAATNSNFVVGVLGNDPMLDALNTNTNRVQNRVWEARRLTNVAEAVKCQMLFVPEAEAKNLSQIFAALKDASVLTVGEGDDFLRMGGIIKLWDGTKANSLTLKLCYEVNLEAARRAKLKLSSQLLRLSVREPRVGF